MKTTNEPAYGPLEPGEVLAPTLVGVQTRGPCTPAGEAPKPIHVVGAWDQSAHLYLDMDLIVKGRLYTASIDLTTDEAIVRVHRGRERVVVTSKERMRKEVLVEARRILERIVDTLPLFARDG